MENKVYERDYRVEWEQRSSEKTSRIKRVGEMIKQSGVLQEIGAYYASRPRIIDPSQKQNYEYLLRELDLWARKMGGKIRGEVSYTKLEATIIVQLPHLEMVSCDEFLLLEDLSKRCDTLSITAVDEGGIRIYIMIEYFQMITDQQDMDNALEQKIHQFPELVAEFKRQQKEAEDQAYKLFSAFKEFVKNVEAVQGETGQDEKAAFIQVWDELRNHPQE